MKEQYFTIENIDIKTREMIDNVKEALKRVKEQVFVPEKSALVIVDMQNYFCDESSVPFVPSSTAIIPKVKNLVEAYRAKNLPVIFTRQMNTPEDAGMMAKWWKYTIPANSQASEITPLINTENAYVVDKSQYDSFYNSNFESILKEKGVIQLVITGLLTHLCSETTARAAFVKGYESFFCVDGNVTYKEIFHTSSLINLAHGVASLVTCDEICEKLQEYEA